MGVDPRAAGDQEDHAAVDRQRAEGDDDRGQVELPDEEAVDRAERGAHREGEEHQREDGDAGEGGVEHGGDHAGQGQVGGDREVDALGQDHRHLAEREHDQDRAVVEDVAEVRRPGEAGEADRDQQDQRGDGGGEQDLAGLQRATSGDFPYAGGGADEALGRHAVAVELGDDAALAHDDDAVGHAEDSRGSRRRP